MKPKTLELLHFLLWSCEHLSRPTFRNLTDSFEAWAYRNGLRRQLAELERQQVLESSLVAGGSNDVRARMLRLTEAGRLQALGGRDPEIQWNRLWDGRWRMVLFDLPVDQSATRDRLRNYLRHRGFGFLQHSVWVSPDPMETEKAILAGSRTDVESLLLLEARPCAGESDQEIVAGAWDFELINCCYATFLEVLATRPTGPLRTEAKAKALRKWANRERAAWLAAVDHDPLLPQGLLPTGYLGQKAWRLRVKALSRAGEQLRSFRA